MITARVLRPALTVSVVIAVMMAALAVYAFLSTGATLAAGPATYNPTITTLYCNGLGNFSGSDPSGELNGGTCDHAHENLQAGAAADYTTTLHIPTGDLNFSSVITFAPAGTTTTAGGAGLPAGTKVGGLESEENLGIGNGACNTDTLVNFVLYSVALPDAASEATAGHPGDPRWASNIAYPRQNGDNHRFNGWLVGGHGTVVPLGGGTTPANTNGINALGTADAIQGYPVYLLDVFAIGGAGGTPILPKALYGGLTKVVGTDWIPLYFAQFDDTQTALLNQLGGGAHILTSSEGEPSVSVLTDPSAPASPSSITDFCSFVNVTTMLLGTSPAPGSHVRATSPGAGTKFVIQYDASLRDLDNDGIENALDTCPKVANAGDPRITGDGDSNSNGIDNNCDTSGSGNDADGDGFQKRQDVCPQVSDVSQAEAELNVTAGDNGPETDSIGDACDSGSSTYTLNGKSVTTTLSTSVANGHYILKTAVVAKCFGATPAGGTDADADGYCATDMDTAGGGGSDSDAVRHNSWSATLRGDADSDHDHFSDAMETYLGTDATKSCAQTLGGGG
ncbi:MAG TPA: thrombospondin type 3 repeat-containing protein, partial [Nitrospiria bacterium]|nr:thrombospondin type 3 repeat-containing protein [Nitrospiria bacterium]